MNVYSRYEYTHYAYVIQEIYVRIEKERMKFHFFSQINDDLHRIINEIYRPKNQKK